MRDGNLWPKQVTQVLVGLLTILSSFIMFFVADIRANLIKVEEIQELHSKDISQIKTDIQWLKKEM